MRFIGLAVLAWTCLSPAIQGVELFGPTRYNYYVGSSPKSVAAGDFNGDHAPDLAAVFTNGVKILVNDGVGGFISATDIRVLWVPQVVAVGDFDGDGHADLAVGKANPTSVSIFLGNGQAEFAHHVTVNTRTTPTSMAVADFNGDRVSDLALAHSDADGSVSILLGDSLGGFSVGQELLVGSAVSAIAQGQFNEGGDIDLAVTVAGFEPNSDFLYILLGDGEGGFSQSPGISLEDDPIAVVTGRFDDNATTDLAVAHGGNNSVSIHLGDDNGGFHKTIQLVSPHSLRYLAAGDFNNDGAVDLTIAGSAVSMLIGDGSGGFLQGTIFYTGDWASSMIVDDFDRDGAVDVAMTHPYRNSVGVFPGDGLGGFQDSLNLPFGAGKQPGFVAVGDFSGDDAEDLAVTEESGDAVQLFLGDGRGGFSPGVRLEVGNRPVCIALGEFGGGSATDMAVANFDDDSVSILLGDGTGSFSRSSDIQLPRFTGDRPYAIASGEFNGDGNTDLVTSNGSGAITVLLQDSAGGFSNFTETTLHYLSTLRWVAVGEFTGDSFEDVVVVNDRPNSNTDSVSILAGDGNGDFELVGDYAVGPQPFFVAVAEFNGDDRADLAVANSAQATGDAGSVTILLGRQDGGFDVADYAVGQKPRFVAVGEFNGDGALDLAAVKGDVSSVSILIGDGLGGFHPALDFGVPGFAMAAAVGDFDKNDASDLAVANLTGVQIIGNQLLDRADIDQSNRIDGFDTAATSRLAGRLSTEEGYQRTVDVNLDQIIDGEDLSLVSSRFGELRKDVSPLRARLSSSLPPAPNTITFQQLESVGDLLKVRVLFDESNDPVAAADFAVSFEPTDTRHEQVLEIVGFAPGKALLGSRGLVPKLDTDTPGRVAVTITRLPSEDQIGSGREALLDLFFRAKREGQAMLEFDPASRLLFVDGCPSNLGCPVAGVSFVGGATVEVDASTGGPPGQRIATVPDDVVFGTVGTGEDAREQLRISNFGFSDLDISRVESTLPEFASFFTDPISIAPYGSVRLPVTFSPTGPGVYSAELVIDSNDPNRPRIRIPLSGRSGLDLSVVPSRLEFGRIAVNTQKSLVVTFANQGLDSLLLTRLQSFDSSYVSRTEFSTLAPGESARIEVTFRPQTTGEFYGDLIVGFDAPEEKRVIVRLTGIADADRDGDTIADRVDNCPTLPNPDQGDVDSDDTGDSCDNCPDDPENDADGDGVCEDIDNCPTDANPEQRDDVHPNGIGDACDDPDMDGLSDTEDNCPDTPNVDQANADADAFGDACDNCPDVPSADQTNTDGDTLGDACDPYPNLSLRVRPIGPDVGHVDQPVILTYRLEDDDGTHLPDLSGVRATLTADGSASYGTVAMQGVLLAGGETGQALVEFVGGLVTLEISDSVAERVALWVDDTERVGIEIAPVEVFEDFESDDGGFFGRGVWEFGPPTSGPLAAFSGVNVWATDLDGPYPPLSSMTVESPTYSLTSRGPSVLEFQDWFSLDDSDSRFVDISTDGGDNWIVLAHLDGTSGGYLLETLDLTAYLGQVIQFRFRLAGGPFFSNRPGWYIDDFRVKGTAKMVEFVSGVEGVTNR